MDDRLPTEVVTSDTVLWKLIKVRCTNVFGLVSMRKLGSPALLDLFIYFSFHLKKYNARTKVDP